MERIGSLAQMASLNLFTYKMPTPSALAYPSADISKVWHVEVPLIMPALTAPMDTSGDCIRLAPPTNAASHSPARSAAQAWCKAKKDEEHAVSIVTLVSKGRPAFSKHSYVTSSSWRCCGSIYRASMELILKNSWSNSRISFFRKYPSGELILAGCWGSGW